MAERQWQVELLRKTYFFDPKLPLSDTHLWAQLIGGEPEERTEKSAAKIITESGDWMDHKLYIGSHLGRVDFIYKASEEGPNLPNAGAFSSRIANLVALAAPSLPGGAMRVALGATLLMPGDSHADCYRMLSEFLPHVQIDEKSREFMYRINNPKFSSVNSEIELNCISTWSAVKGVYFSLASNESFERYAVRLEIDVSTAADKVLYDFGDVNHFMGELVGISESVVKNGARP